MFCQQKKEKVSFSQLTVSWLTISFHVQTSMGNCCWSFGLMEYHYKLQILKVDTVPKQKDSTKKQTCATVTQILLITERDQAECLFLARWTGPFLVRSWDKTWLQRKDYRGNASELEHQDSVVLRRRRRSDSKWLQLSKFPTSFHRSPRAYQTRFHGSPQIFIQVFSRVNGVPVTRKI